MSERRHIPEPGEQIYLPRPSWAPVFFAAGGLGLVAGTYAAGLTFPPIVYAVAGAIVLLASFRSMVGGAVRDFFSLPRRQRTQSAPLPVEAISAPPRSR